MVRSYRPLQTAQKTISDQNCACYDNQYGSKTQVQCTEIFPPSPLFSYDLLCVAFCLSSSFYSIAVANIERHGLCIENDMLIKSNIVYRDVL